jgi:hypothetical protein
MVGEHLTGSFRVRALRPALGEVFRLCDRWSENAEIRRHALKLRYWPEKCAEDESGVVVDLDWSWIKALPGMHVGELRIDDVIAGNDNLRIIFYVGEAALAQPLRMIWILRVMQKKRQDFSRYDISIFKARRTLVMERFYNAQR